MTTDLMENRIVATHDSFWLIHPSPFETHFKMCSSSQFSPHDHGGTKKGLEVIGISFSHKDIIIINMEINIKHIKSPFSLLGFPWSFKCTNTYIHIFEDVIRLCIQILTLWYEYNKIQIKRTTRIITIARSISHHHTSCNLVVFKDHLDLLQHVII